MRRDSEPGAKPLVLPLAEIILISAVNSLLHPFNSKTPGLTWGLAIERGGIRTHDFHLRSLSITLLYPYIHVSFSIFILYYIVIYFNY